jgi:transcriptional regulator with XRE-family HTH domain
MNLDTILDTPYDEVGTVIRAHRKALGLSRQDLSELSGVNISTILRLECNYHYKWGTVHAVLVAFREAEKEKR